MPADFLTQEQKLSYGKYPKELSSDQLDKYFYLDDKDKELIFRRPPGVEEYVWIKQLAQIILKKLKTYTAIRISIVIVILGWLAYYTRKHGLVLSAPAYCLNVLQPG